MLKKFLIVFWNFSLLVMWVHADCTLKIEENAPRLEKDFGSRKVVLSKNIQNIRISPGETILAYCSTNIRLRVNNQAYIDFKDSIGNIILQCGSNKEIIYKIPEDNVFVGTSSYFFDPVTIGCSTEQDQQLYESQKTLPNCEKYLSYGIGVTSPTNNKTVVTAAICYDLNALKLKYATYFAYRAKYDITSDKHYFINPPVDLDNKLNYYDIYFLGKFMSQLSFNVSHDKLKSSEHLLNLFDFDYANLIQDRPLESALSDYTNLFNIVWWRNLRVGNWKKFLSAFGEHANHFHYMVYTGTSGIVQIPTECNKTRHLNIEADEAIVSVPEYIWSYLTPGPNNSRQAVVIIGYNSPFSTHPKANDNNHPIIFCHDICNEIGWLRSGHFDELRLIPTMGLIFCCRPEEIGQHLDNFPHDALGTHATTPHDPYWTESTPTKIYR